MHSFDLMNNLRMAFTTGALRYFAITLVHQNFVRVTSGGKCERMPESVFSFGKVFRKKSGRRMAIIACSYRTVTRLDPSIVITLHYVAIRTGSGIVRQIGAA